MLIILFVSIISFMKTQSTPISPCPEIFMYHQLNVSEVWVALVFIPTPQMLPIKLDVFLYLEAVLPSKYVGILELYEPRDIVLDRLSKLIWKPIVYIIRFPLPSPLPIVKNISVNNKILCISPPVISTIITTIHLEHTLFPRHVHIRDEVVTKKSIDFGNYGEGFETQDVGYISKYDDVCGDPILTNPLIASGRPIQPAEWPWLVAVFVTQAFGLQFHCSATLISEQYVLTAGHCMDHEESGLLTRESVLLYLGKYNLKNWTETNSILRQAQDICIHPKYNRHNFTYDIALVKFEKIKYTAYIKPACLWSRSSNLGPFVGKIGMVVGWGSSNSKNGLKSEPHSVQVRIVSQEECLRSRADFAYLTSEYTFCAGNKNGSGPCNGDSGTGLFIQKENSRKWELRGIVSLSLLNTKTRSCNLNEYTVYTDAAKFHDWLSAFVT